MTKNPIQMLVETVDFASATIEEIMLITLQNRWEVLSFKISNGLQV